MVRRTWCPFLRPAGTPVERLGMWLFNLAVNSSTLKLARPSKTAALPLETLQAAGLSVDLIFNLTANLTSTLTATLPNWHPISNPDCNPNYPPDCQPNCYP